MRQECLLSTDCRSILMSDSGRIVVQNAANLTGQETSPIIKTIKNQKRSKFRPSVLSSTIWIILVFPSHSPRLQDNEEFLLSLSHAVTRSLHINATVGIRVR